MDTLAAIHSRRSIRKFRPDPIPRWDLERILQAGIQAPSAKNRQPWRLVAVTSDAGRRAMGAAMAAGLDFMDALGGFDQALMKGAWYTRKIMLEAPATVFVLNPYGKAPEAPLAPYGERFGELANVQSVGACIQNMCLAATDLGLGSLWICDVFQAYDALVKWLGTGDQLVAALALGYADEAPAARPRMGMEDVVRWV